MDTVKAHAESGTHLRVRFGEDTGDSVWHGRILEHADDDRRQPLVVVP